MSEVYKETIGSLEKPNKPLVRKRNGSGPVPNWKHESEESTALRRAKNLEFIFETFKDPYLEASGLVMVKIGGLRFDLYPATNCYFIHSTQQYGFGIEKLCEQVRRKFSLS